MYVTHFAYPLPMDERLGCISLLSVVNGAGMNIRVQYLLESLLAILLGLDLGVVLPAHMSILTF